MGPRSDFPVHSLEMVEGDQDRPAVEDSFAARILEEGIRSAEVAGIPLSNSERVPKGSQKAVCLRGGGAPYCCG